METTSDTGCADNPVMVGAGHWRKRLALGLALWASLPWLEWCPFSWEDWKSCEKGGAAPACAAVGGPMAAGACDPIEAEACAAHVASCALPCDPLPDPVPFRDCAWCVRSPIDGVPVRGLDPPAHDTGHLIYAMVEAPRLRPPARAARERLEIATACPAFHAPHAPPQSRAPPSV